MARMVRKPRKHFLYTSYFVLGGALLFVLWLALTTRVAAVPSASMEPTLLPGDLLLLRIDAYRHRQPERGDLLIFRDAKDGKQLLVKRVVGLPRENIFVDGGQVWVDGKFLAESYIDLPFLTGDRDQVTLQEDEFWVMGDNRTKSEDSRDYGPVTSKQFVGRATTIIWPFDRRTRLVNGGEKPHAP